MRLRKLNEVGLGYFREFLREARENGACPPKVPEYWIESPLTSQEVVGMPELETFPHQISGYELARYLHDQFKGLDPAVIEGAKGLGDPGFWGAVALFYFDLITPGYGAGLEKPKADDCFIPQTDITVGRYFRHRVAGPYRLYKLRGKLSEPLLLLPVGKQSTLYSKITDSVFYTETPCVIEAVNLLYFDARNRRLKRNWNAKDEPGALTRLLAVVDQLDLTYDLLGISGEALVKRLPKEFDLWRPRERT